MMMTKKSLLGAVGLIALCHCSDDATDTATDGADAAMGGDSGVSTSDAATLSEDGGTTLDDASSSDAAIADSAPTDAGASDAGVTYAANVVVAQTGTAMVAGTAYKSSSKLSVTWSAPAGTAPHHYDLIASETVGGTVTTFANATSPWILSSLKAGTTYSVTVKACVDAACTSYTASAASGTGATADETWQLQGTGHAFASLTKVVSDGNSKISGNWFGSGAGAQSNKVQLYYGPLGAAVKGLAVGTMAGTADANNVSSVMAFTSTSGTYGLVSPPTSGPLITDVATGESVPVSTALGSKIRLFFEATGSDNKSRIMYLDSQDGYTGLDFNSGAASVCSTAADYGVGGGCAPTVVIGIEGDSVAGNTGIANARQFKLGYPKLSDWRWDGAAGTFMVFTLNPTTACMVAGQSKTQGYAVYDGTKWNVQRAGTGCPKLFYPAQAPMPVHLGGVKYKMYFGDPNVTTGKNLASGLPWLGPKKIVYADGAKTGAAGTVEFEDWESQVNARVQKFLWPDGTAMSDSEIGYIDDFTMMAPTGNLEFQVMYMAITDSVQPPMSGGAKLVNP